MSGVDAELGQSAILTYLTRLGEALPRIRDRVATAALRAGRAASEVTLVGVTKTHPAEAVEAALQAGLTDLGENRVEELARKREAFDGRGIRWHLIGHVQSRKSEAALGAADLFHALDSVRLADRMARQLEGQGSQLDVLLQVNTSGEDAKGGFSLDGAEDEIAQLLDRSALRIRGLMTMAPYTEDQQVVRQAFTRLRELHERLSKTSEYSGTELSMGMTSDFEIAIEEGSTLVRIGTALFGART